MSKAVMKEALNALKTCDWDYDYEENAYQTFDNDLVNDAVDALEAELAKPEQPDLRKAATMALYALENNLPLIEDYGSKEDLNIQHEAIVALHKTLAQPEQEYIECDDYEAGGMYWCPEAIREQTPVSHLWECIGRWSSYLALNGEKANLAPPEWLVDAVKAATAQPEHPLDKKAANARELGLDYEVEHGFDRTASHMAGEYVDTAGTEHQFKYAAYGLRADENGKLSIGELPKREWQGLTDDEILSAAKEVPITCIRQRDYDLHFAPIIEAKLKEKNT